jgi:hypothetical protein
MNLSNKIKDKMNKINIHINFIHFKKLFYVKIKQ